MNSSQVFAELVEQYNTLATRAQVVEDAINTSWINSCTYLVFLMQVGFLLIEAGSVRHKNYVSSILKNVLDVVIGTLAWWLIGYGFAYGDDHNGFIGRTGFAANKGEVNTLQHYNRWMFQWAFSSTANTIVSGCIQERMPLFGFMILAAFTNLWIYPVIGTY